jgi:hypothetical protein
MRLLSGGVAHVASVIEGDLASRATGLQKPHISGMADLCAVALVTRSCNTGEWMSIVPRKGCAEKSRERYISRFLSNELIEAMGVMGGFIPELLEMAGSHNKVAILMMDQSKIVEGFECLMMSLRVGERAIPVAWRVIATSGPIGFDVQEKLLDDIVKRIPEGVSILLAADRFYGTASLIKWCQRQGWQYRIRLKGNLILQHEGGEITSGKAADMGLASIENALLNETGVSINIGILHEPGHKEPWIIAMDCKPSKYKTLDYGMRWGIESLFSDFKSRGFGITKTHLKHPDRIERLILVLTIALYWAVSTGMKPKTNQRQTKKNTTDL